MLSSVGISKIKTAFKGLKPTHEEYVTDDISYALNEELAIGVQTPSNPDNPSGNYKIFVDLRGNIGGYIGDPFLSCECITEYEAFAKVKQIREVFKLIDTDVFKWFNDLSYTTGFDTVVAKCRTDYNRKTNRR